MSNITLLTNINDRLDDVGQAVANNPDFQTAFDKCHQLYDILRFGTSPELMELSGDKLEISATKVQRSGDTPPSEECPQRMGQNPT